MLRIVNHFVNVEEYCASRVFNIAIGVCGCRPNLDSGHGLSSSNAIFTCAFPCDPRHLTNPISVFEPSKSVSCQGIWHELSGSNCIARCIRRCVHLILGDEIWLTQDFFFIIMLFTLLIRTPRGMTYYYSPCNQSEMKVWVVK